MRYKAKFAPSDLLCPLRFTWHALSECLPALESLQARLPAGQSGSGRCVVLSDVARESREEDGSVPKYSAPSMTIRLESDPAANAGAAGGEGNKKKRKKKKKKAKIAAGTAASSHAADDEEEGEDDEEGGEDGAKTSSVDGAGSVAAAAAAAASAAAATTSTVTKPTSTSNNAAATSSTTAAVAASSAPRPAPRVVVSASAPYVFDSAAAQSVAAQRQAMAQACVGSIPLLIQQRLMTLDQLTAQGQRQVRAPLLEWAARVGTELAQRVAVRFG
jgi:hypothetical protein